MPFVPFDEANALVKHAVQALRNITIDVIKRAEMDQCEEFVAELRRLFDDYGDPEGLVEEREERRLQQLDEGDV